MKNAILLIILAFSGLLFSCKESSIDPNTQTPTVNTKAQSEALLKGSTWVLYSSSSNKDAAEPKIITLGSDYSYTSKRTTNTKVSYGYWSLSSSGDTLIIYGNDTIISQVQDVNYFKITKLNNEELNFELRNNSDYATFEFLSIPNNSIYAIAGNIDNTKNLSLNNASFTAFWDVCSGSPDYNCTFGKGEFKVNKTKFVFYFSKAPSDFALNNDTKNGNLYKYGVGYISLTNKPYEELTIINSDNRDTFLASIIGVIDNRAILYQNSAPETSNGYARDWESRFPVGYSFGKGLIFNTNETFDEWILGEYPITMKVDTNLDSFTFPNWY